MGMISCSPGDDGFLTWHDSCSFTCNDGYVLSGSATRQCLYDVFEGMYWSGSKATCKKSKSIIYIQTVLM